MRFIGFSSGSFKVVVSLLKTDLMMLVVINKEQQLPIYTYNFPSTVQQNRPRISAAKFLEKGSLTQLAECICFACLKTQNPV